jgi:hypothetical protein
MLRLPRERTRPFCVRVWFWFIKIEGLIFAGRGLSFKGSIDGLFASNLFQKLMDVALFAIDE